MTFSFKMVAKGFRWLALFILIFSSGIGVAIYNERYLLAAASVVKNLWAHRQKVGTGTWFESRFHQKGVLRHDPERAFQGYTVFAVASRMSVFLLDMDGRIVHEWKIPEGVAESKGASSMFGWLQPHVDAATLLPNGDIIVVYAQPGVGAYGFAALRLDKNSNVVWRYDGKAHHVVKVVGNRVYSIAQEFTRANSKHPVETLRGMGYLDDEVLVLDTDGHLVTKASVIDMMLNSPSLHLGERIPFNVGGDPIHTNAIEVITEDNARFIPNAKPGDVLLSLRYTNMIVLADLQSRSIKWVLRGSWEGQHDVRLLPNGHITLFDNDGDLTNTGRSRVIEVDPMTGGIVWSYNGTQMDPLYTENRGGAQRLPNGNTLVNESNTGRMIEVAANGDVVWEYVQSLDDPTGERSVHASLSLGIERYAPDYVSSWLKEEKRQASR
jgi:hypothetical protein